MARSDVMTRARAWPAVLLLVLQTLARPGYAQVPLGRLQEFLQATAARRPLARGSLSIVHERRGQPLAAFAGARWVSLGERHAALRVADAQRFAWAAEMPDAIWAPPLHLLLDRSRTSLGLEAAVQSSGAGTGQGVVIGIVDAGVDVSHPDLRNSDGTTRVAWWIDFSSNPAGLHPELEAAFGCEAQAGLSCQILDAADLNALLERGGARSAPADAIGHGTHIASIAAGNGSAGPDAALAGIAPEATLIVARVLDASGSIAETDVALATRFVFERAQELGMPAVVNLSLGADFGAHDGSSELSQQLASFVGAAHPGRAIVVAAGNSGQLLRGLTNDAREPLGIHTEVQVAPRSSLRVPLLTPAAANGRTTTDASVFVWINLFPVTELSVSLELPDGSRIEPVALGQSDTRSSAEVTAAIVHGLPGDALELPGEFSDVALGDLAPSRDAAVILIDGRWQAGGSFQIEFSGQGRAELWAQSEGDLAPEVSLVGAVFQNASAQQTITIPASDPALIAVGASVNRLDWTDYSDAALSYPEPGFDSLGSVGDAALFSSAGPNRLGDIKPDLLAPGAFVIAALSGAADPRLGGPSVFSGLCVPLGCQVISPRYAITAGTSMAAPMLSGALALLLQRDPSLTQDELRGLAQTGSDALAEAAEPASREGGGVLNIERSFAAVSTPERARGELPDPERSRLRFAGEFVPVDTDRSLTARLWLRDAQGGVFDAAAERVSAQVEHGELRSRVERLGPGLYGVRVGAASPAATLRLELRLDERPFLSGQLPIVGGEPPRPSSDEGCALGVAPRRALPLGGLWPLVALGALVSRRWALRSR